MNENRPADGDVLRIAREAAASVVSESLRAPYLEGQHDHFTVVQAAVKAILLDRKQRDLPASGATARP
jgi:hypothetical protein